VCLDRHHSSPLDFRIDIKWLVWEVAAEWEVTSKRIRNAWANSDDATRDGAYACVLAALETVTGMIAVRRAETRTGADYYIAKPGGGEEDLEDCIRLEISGLDAGSLSRIRQRLREKLDQAASGASNLPAIVGIVGFNAKIVMLRSVREDQ
jgi:hypothetical protein